MIKQDIIELIENFIKETWKYNDTQELNDDLEYIYSIENKLNKTDEVNIKNEYNKLISFINLIRLKHGFESTIIQTDSNLNELKTIIDNISLNDENVIDKSSHTFSLYINYIKEYRNLDFIKNNYENIQGQEGLYLAIESLKSLITNPEYKKLISGNNINQILVDLIKLNNGVYDLEVIEQKYKKIVQDIWQNSLSTSIDNNENFRVLFSNISSGGDLRNQAKQLMNRPSQSSCSMISSNFIATYGSLDRKIGFIYPNNSEIIMASAYDLYSNVFGTGAVNKEKGSMIATPEVLEKIGIENAKKKNEDLYASTCYNEILVNSKPCGIAVIGLGENDLNIDYYDTKMLAAEMNLPIYYIDTMKYKDKLSEEDKHFIAFHTILSYLDKTPSEVSQMVSDNPDYMSYIFNQIDAYKEQISEVFVRLKQEGKLNKDNMINSIENVINIEKDSDKVK